MRIELSICKTSFHMINTKDKQLGSEKETELIKEKSDRALKDRPVT